MKRLALIAVLFGACTSEGSTAQTLKASGFTEIQLTGYSWSCGRDDTTCTGFVAKGPTGQKVEGAVGCGLLFKGCTVRLTGTK